jgi:hypothetical protein
VLEPKIEQQQKKDVIVIAAHGREGFQLVFWIFANGHFTTGTVQMSAKISESKSMTFDPGNLGLFTIFSIFAAGPAGISYFLWRLTLEAPPRWKLTLRIASVALMCVAVAVAFLVLAVAFTDGLHSG